MSQRRNWDEERKKYKMFWKFFVCSFRVSCSPGWFHIHCVAEDDPGGCGITGVPLSSASVELWSRATHAR